MSDNWLSIPLGPQLCLQVLPSSEHLANAAVVLRAHLQRAADQGESEIAPLEQLAERVYAEVEGLGRSYAVSSAIAGEPLRFRLSQVQVEAVGLGAEFGFGIDDARMRVAHTCRRAQRAQLLLVLHGAGRAR